jgi:hypothetical protein
MAGGPRARPARRRRPAHRDRQAQRIGRESAAPAHRAAAEVVAEHRYTADLAVKAAMLARGYVAEGYGPDATIMCAAA